MSRIVRCAAGAAAALLVATASPALAGTNCQLGNGLKHIVYIQFDNVHLRRDNPNVPSDLEQMPSLLQFLRGNGTLLTNHHTPLISHTSVDILTSLTGVYGDKMGMPIGNTILYFNGTSSKFTSSFAYWTDNLGTTTVPQMVDRRGKVHPAPWVPFTRAGCDVGAFSIANIELENTGSDINTVFGNPSPEAAEVAAAAALPNTPANAKARAVPAADFEGIAIHCAQGSPICAGSPHARPDVLNDEPQGYTGYQALFGNKYVAPAINGGATYVNDLNGNHVVDSYGNDGFPSAFSPTPSQTLGYGAQMLEAGVPVVYLYIEDAHDNHHLPNAPSNPDGTFGPGEVGYVMQLKTYDAAFSAFFARLAAHGITKENTLFVVTSDENDHFAGSVASASPPGCDGVTVACTYPIKGEVAANLSNLLLGQFNDSTRINIDFDTAPGIWIDNNPAQTDPVTRTLEREAGSLIGYDPITGATGKPIAQALADHAEQTLLHMVTSDPNRTPNFILFANPDYYLSSTFAPTACTGPTCFVENRNFAWMHGDFQRDIVQTWLGVVGPGVRNLGQTGELFTDHTDIRPTILSLSGLKDDYEHDGRVLFEILHDRALPVALRGHSETLPALAEAYKQINAPTGKLGIKTLTGISTDALKGDDATYARLEAQIIDLTKRRNDIAGKMIGMLENAAFNGQKINEPDARRLIEQAEELLEEGR